MFNYQLTPKGYKEIKSGNLVFNLPEYGDLLGEEYDVIEALEREDLAWNQRLIEVTEKIAFDRGLDLWQVSKMITQAETGTNEEKAILLGNHVVEFANVLASRPTEMRRVYKIAAAMIRRVDEGVTEETVKKLPRKFLQQIVDFAQAEQAAQNYIPYNDLLTRYEMVQTEVNGLREIAQAAAAIKSKPKALNDAITAYFINLDNAGKSDTQSE